MIDRDALAADLQDVYITSLSFGRSVNQVWLHVADYVLDLAENAHANLH